MRLGEPVIRTGEIGMHAGRGKHTTTQRQLYVLENGGMVIDNPGVREVGLIETEGELDTLFDDITNNENRCKYTDCTHTHEPGCVVVQAVEDGEIDEERYANYVSLKKESEYNEMNDFEKRGKDRAFGKFIKNAKKDIKKYKG